MRARLEEEGSTWWRRQRGGDSMCPAPCTATVPCQLGKDNVMTFRGKRMIIIIPPWVLGCFFTTRDAQAFVFSQKSPPLRKAEGGFSMGWQHGDAGGVRESLVRALGFWGRGSVGGSGLRGAYTEPSMSPWWPLHSMRRHEGLFQEILWYVALLLTKLVQ